MANARPLLLSDSTFQELWNLCCGCDFSQRKALITLSRSQSIPGPDSPVLLSKVQPILDILVVDPPFTNLSYNTLTIEGEVVLRLLQRPYLSHLLLVFALGVPLSEDQISSGREESFRKEFNATQTRRLPGTWDWDSILDGGRYPKTVVHVGAPDLSPLQFRFQSKLRNFRNRIHGSTVLPHYTRRGISSETATMLANRVDKRYSKIHGPRRTFHRRLNLGNVTSLDVIHHYIRTGVWIHGRTEMKQRWYPHGLLPRTYFAWGGSAIAYSSYLRNFFNDLADQFPPTQRNNRVQPDWLYNSDIKSEGGFGFYDLTSFTSWFHEQCPFLESLSKYFVGTTLYLVGPELGLVESDLGAMIDNYIRWCNDFPEFIVSKKLSGEVMETVSFAHQCAGFLGVPGNLITCTLPHGLAVASGFSGDSHMQVPGDDVGFSFVDEDSKVDTMRVASSLGVLQFDKVYALPQLSLYLKRLVIDKGTSIDLADVLIYPLLPFLIPRDVRNSDRPSQFRLPDQSVVTRRACSVLAAFHRDLWNMTRGSLSPSESHLILSFVRGIHTMMKIPFGAVFQSRLYGDDGFEENDFLQGVTIKFPVDDDDCLYFDPVLSFCSRYVETMRIRMTTDVEVTRDIGDLPAGKTIYVPKHRGWTFLEDMGYVDIVGIPGEVVTLVGVDAKDAFLVAQEPNLREVIILSDLKVYDLVSLGILKESEDSLGEFLGGFGEVVRDIRSEQSWRYGKYIDLDNPRSFGRNLERGSTFRPDSSIPFSDDPFGNDLELDY